jgi:undecaprenyl-diphosphatase
MRLTIEQKKTAAIIIIGFLLLLVSFPLDSMALSFFQGMTNPVLDYIFGWVSYVLSLVIILLVMTSLFMWEENKKDWILPLWFSCLFTLVVVYVIKFIVARERPHEVIYLFGWKDYSFPSAHAGFSFAAVPILDREYPMLKWFWIIFAVFVVLSRLYLQVHYLSDVIAGVLIGYCIGKGVIYLKTKYSIFG